MEQKVAVEKEVDAVLERGENADHDQTARVANFVANKRETTLAKVAQNIEKKKAEINTIQPK